MPQKVQMNKTYGSVRFTGNYAIQIFGFGSETMCQIWEWDMADKANTGQDKGGSPYRLEFRPIGYADEFKKTKIVKGNCGCEHAKIISYEVHGREVARKPKVIPTAKKIGVLNVTPIIKKFRVEQAQRIRQSIREAKN